MTKLHDLHAAGQSVWIDYIRRDMLTSGSIHETIADGVRGLTSNPSIFKIAIADSSDYDADIEQLNAAGAGVEQICESLMVQDVGAAADLLRPVYDQTDGADGFASIEVSPLLAHETDKTVVAAERLWAKLNRPNIMIKVPGTPAGIPAVRTLLEQGINVNITLLFSVGRYTEVAQSYLDALVARDAAGKPVDTVASVAS